MLVYIGGLHSTVNLYKQHGGVIKGSGRSIKLVQRASVVMQTATAWRNSPTSGGTFNEPITSRFLLQAEVQTDDRRSATRETPRFKSEGEPPL